MSLCKYCNKYGNKYHNKYGNKHGEMSGEASSVSSPHSESVFFTTASTHSFMANTHVCGCDECKSSPHKNTPKGSNQFLTKSMFPYCL